MDWTKAKSILIVALIITNIVLILSYAFRNDISESTEVSVLNDTIALLDSKNIFIETTIPKKHNRMPTLSVEYDNMNQDRVNKILDQQNVLTKEEQTDEKIIEATTKFIGQCGFLTENVEFDKIEKKDNKIIVIYKNYIDNIAIEDSYIRCTLINGKIEELQRYWLKPIGYSKTKKAIIPAAAALIKFMSGNEDDGKIYVKEISLVYWLDLDSFDSTTPVSDTALPAWKITYNNDKITHIMAFEQ